MFENNQKKNNKIRNLKELSKLANPCLLKGYYNIETKSSGTGDYNECYIQINKTLRNKFLNSEDLFKNKSSILLGDDFKDIADIISNENITLKNFEKFTEDLCSIDYLKLKKKYFYINVDNICFKSTYSIIIFHRLFKNHESLILVFATNIRNISLEEENDIIMSNYFSFQVDSIPTNYLIIFFFLIGFFLTNYLFKYKFISIIERNIFRYEISSMNVNEKLDILDTTINSLPVKNFLYTKLLREIKEFSNQYIFVSFSEFKTFFYTLVDKYPPLLKVIKETIKKRNELKASKVFSLIQIFLVILLSIFTNKIFSFVTKKTSNTLVYVIVVFSIIYVTLLIIECLILITYIDNEKYYYSNILTQPEKLFLEQEFSTQPDHNNELF